MKLFRKIKKGFTLVELVVVIAVIAILAAVSVVSYIGVTNNAKKSNDLTILKQVNETLVLRQEKDGVKPQTMHEALEILDEDLGVSNLDKLLTASYKKYEFAYDLSVNRFVLLEGEKISESAADYTKEEVDDKSLFWKFSSDVASNDEYSHYLKDGYNADVVTCSGLDVGNNNIKNVTYNKSENAKSVVMRTNGGALEINASTDTVTHFGVTEFIQINSIDTEHCWNEFGYTEQAQIKTGKVVNKPGKITINGEEKNVGVQNLFIEANDAGTGFETVIVEAKDGAILPNLDRQAVEYEDSVKVVQVTTDDYDKSVWLYQEGTVEEIRMADANATSVDSTTPTADGDSQEKVATEICNANSKSDQGKPTAEDIDKTEGSDALYAGGVGSKTNPYIIGGFDWWLKFCEACAEDSTFAVTKGKFFKVIDDIDVSGTTERANVHYMAGSIDFGGHTFTGLTKYNAPASDVSDDGITAIFSRLSLDVAISNIDFTTTQITNGSNTVAAQVAARFHAGDYCNVLFENIVTRGDVAGITFNNSGLLLAYTYACKGNVTARNCTNYANLSGSGYTSAFMGSIGYFKENDTITFDNCVNYGTITSTSGASMLFSNPGRKNVNINIKDCQNAGIIKSAIPYSTLLKPSCSPGDDYNTLGLVLNGTTLENLYGNDAVRAISAACGDELYGKSVELLNTTELTVNEGKFVLNPVANATRYEMSFSFSVNEKFGGGSGYTMYLTAADLANVYVYDWINKSQADGEIVEHSTTCSGKTAYYYTCGEHYVFNDDGTIRDDVVATFLAYKGNTLVSAATYTY